MFRRALLALVLLASLAGAQQPAPQFFRITPVRPVAELRAEALKAQPPAEQGSFRAPELVELVALDPTIRLDIRYATARNFLGTPVYEQARAFLQRPAAEALVRAHRRLRAQGYGLLIHDAYRPWYVTKIFWDATPPDKHEFVANPQEGSRHNRGCAVDLTLYDLKTGEVVAMPSLYDEMTARAYSNYAGGSSEESAHRALLKQAMEAEGFTQLPNEWWHFDYRDWSQYPILNLPFDRIPAPASAGVELMQLAHIGGLDLKCRSVRLVVKESGVLGNAEVTVRKLEMKWPYKGINLVHIVAMKEVARLRTDASGILPLKLKPGPYALEINAGTERYYANIRLPMRTPPGDCVEERTVVPEDKADSK